MEIPRYIDSPFQIQLSFFEVIENLEKVAADQSNSKSSEARDLLAEVALHPELKEGITDLDQVEENAELISKLLIDFFPPGLGANEIKAVSLPYRKVIFNHTERFKNILRAAGPDFETTIRDFDAHQLYVLSCCIILNEFYGTKLDFTKPLFFDIPTAEGVMRHYRILYNAEFLHILPTEKSLKLTKEDIDLLLDNYDDLDLWKQKFPKESWIIKGFAIINLFDATIENAVSLLKEKLLMSNVSNFKQSMETIFRSIYQIPDIKIGFMFFNKKEGAFNRESISEPVKSFIINDDKAKANSSLCNEFYKATNEQQTYFAISDVEEYLANKQDSELARHLLNQNIRSIILAPVVKNDALLGVLEVVSPRVKDLHSVNAHKLELVMPFFTDTIERMITDFQNEVQAIIQTHYTTIHPSVNWRFTEEAEKLIRGRKEGSTYDLKEIVFKNVYPLYGQIDIKSSSDTRNYSIQKDLQNQLQELITVFTKLSALPQKFTFTDDQDQVNMFLEQLKEPLQANTEQQVSDYLATSIHDKFQQITDPAAAAVLECYFAETSKKTGNFYAYRRKYETTVSLINDKLTHYLDSMQASAQAIYPHYFERFRTDGVDFNMYMGGSISPGHEFSLEKLQELRMWQLRVLCQMERAHHNLKPVLPYPFDVTTLILTYHSTISIRFRMDEKHFDVDGTYNARFEIIKKRIDKACIKGTDERITQEGKITIVYSSPGEEREYKAYIETLQKEQLLKDGVESFEVQDLQGVAGLRALRVAVSHKS